MKKHQFGYKTEKGFEKGIKGFEKVVQRKARQYREDIQILQEVYGIKSLHKELGIR